MRNLLGLERIGELFQAGQRFVLFTKELQLSSSAIVSLELESSDHADRINLLKSGVSTGDLDLQRFTFLALTWDTGNQERDLYTGQLVPVYDGEMIPLENFEGIQIE